MNRQKRQAAAAAALLLAALACNLPEGTGTPELDATALAGTLSVVQTTMAAPTFTPTPSRTPIPTFPSSTQRPTVVIATLCWLGPGPAYEVSSSVSAGLQVDLLGRDFAGEWWIIRGPIYHDPCWVMRNTLQIDPSFNTSSLPIYTAPPTPTPTPTDTPTLTPTP
jgi:hypothetical protein